MLRRSALVRQQHHDTGGVTEIIELWSRKAFWRTSAAMGIVSAGVGVAGYPIMGTALGISTALFVYRGYLDINQTRHTLLANFPVLAHTRYILESLRPEIRQYLLESDLDGAPFSREQRAVVYQRSKGETDSTPFGTRRDVYAPNHELVLHSMYPAKKIPFEDARVMIGEGSGCKKPYSASIFNVSAMSFGALSHAAVRALNEGAKIGGFFSHTGEGGLSPHHEQGGDLVLQLGTAYFGFRNHDGSFNVDKFREKASRDQVKMIEIKLSQGAKPGKGGVLLAAKVDKTIAGIRDIPVGKDCISPARHSAFSTPTELLDFAATLREASGGKPVGIKLCVGDPIELAMLIRASAEQKKYLDYIAVDGAEGGTGAAPLEFSNSIGLPLLEGVYWVHNLLRGASIRQHTKVIAASKITTGFKLFRALHLGADLCNCARGFMLALGCIQSLKCNTNQCPTGITTCNEDLIAGLDVNAKKTRVASFHKKTIESALDIMAACGFETLTEVRNRPVLMMRTSATDMKFSMELFPKTKDGELLRLDEQHRREGEHSRVHASVQGMSPKDRLMNAWLISGDPELLPKIKLYQQRERKPRAKKKEPAASAAAATTTA